MSRFIFMQNVSKNVAFIGILGYYMRGTIST